MLCMVYAGHFLSLIRLISGFPLVAVTALFHLSSVSDGTQSFRWNSRSKSGNPGIWSTGTSPVLAMAYAHREVVCVGHSSTQTWLILDAEFRMDSKVSCSWKILIKDIQDLWCWTAINEGGHGSADKKVLEEEERPLCVLTLMTMMMITMTMKLSLIHI